jgi:hypothetical protein
VYWSVSYRSLNKDAWVRFQASPRKICNVQITLLYTLLQVLQFPPCQYHSSTALDHSLVHLSLTPCNLSNCERR